jgi:hypothetical protein
MVSYVITNELSRVLRRESLQVFYDYFPPKGMNVQVKLVPVGEINGVKSALKRFTLVATKEFRAGETIYKASYFAGTLITGPHRRNRRSPWLLPSTPT